MVTTSAGSGGVHIEQYEHKGKSRVNNPPVGLVTSETDREAGRKTYSYDPHIDPVLQFDPQSSVIEALIDQGLAADTLAGAKAVLEELKKRRQPYLNWAGKAERTSFEVSTVSLHVHERIDPRTVIEAIRKRDGDDTAQLPLFESPAENPPLRQAIEFYRHKHNWSNRLIAGDSLLVMNSLLEKEGMAGQVQMVYVDPPYGIRYGSNFQPFVNKREVQGEKDEDLTQEPEMLKAFRDTWELGVHSYLSYLRDRLLLARELLHESGSCFVQMSDANLHLVRCVMDDVFGADNYCGLIPFRKKTMPPGSQTIEQMCDFLVWYCKRKRDPNGRLVVKARPLFTEYSVEGLQDWIWVQERDGTRRRLTKAEHLDHRLLPPGARVYRLKNPEPLGDTEEYKYDYAFEGRVYHAPAKGWGTAIEKMDRLRDVRRIQPKGNLLNFVLFHDDYPITRLTSPWTDTVGAQEKRFVVQTSELVLQRCILMATDPGDLVVDPTCGSGTTAFVAEQWGRRWITCDTSRVAITIAKQRLMTAVFDYYELARPDEGVASGFVYKKVPHVTLKSIANDEPPAEETLYDQPYVDNSKVRVTGPFTVEAVPAPVVRSLGEIAEEETAHEDGAAAPSASADSSVARSGETLRQAEWRDELLRCGIRAKGGRQIRFSRVEPLSGTRWLHADAETKPPDAAASPDQAQQAVSGCPERVVVSFGPEHAPLDQRQVELAIEEAQRLVPRPRLIVFAAFQFDPEAAKDIDETEWPGVTLLKVQMNTDLLTEDLKKKRASNESFWLIGQPDIELRRIADGEHEGKWQVEVNGFDYYDPRTGAIESGGKDKIAMWMLDTDYDGRSLYPRQVFFPMAGEKDGWAKLAKSLKAEIDEELVEAYRGTVSLPFVPGEHKRVAVKIVDDRGIESLRIVEVQ